MKQHSWKKQLLTAAVLGAITTIPATGMAAAAGGFDDVPHDNWSYGAIQTLLKDGVIDSFDDNTFNGQKIVTRFEMAQIVRRATNKAVNSTTLSDNDKALIIKLSQEYKKELTQLKSGSLSNSSASAGATMVRPGKNGIMDFSGTKAYIRYDYWQNHSLITDRTNKVAGGDQPDKFFADVELRGRYEIAPKWNARFMFEQQRSVSGKNDYEHGEGQLKEFSFDGPLKVGKLKNSHISFGRYKYKPVLGYVTKAYMQGGIFNWQATKKLKMEIAYGDLSHKYYRADKVNTLTPISFYDEKGNEINHAKVLTNGVADSKGNLVIRGNGKSGDYYAYVYKDKEQKKLEKVKFNEAKAKIAGYNDAVNYDYGESVLYAPFSEQMLVISGRYQLDRKTRLYGGFYSLNSHRKVFRDAQIYEFAGQHEHDKIWTSYWDYARSSRSEDNSLYYYGLRYHKEDKQVPHSWSWMLQLAWHEAKSTINSDLDIKNYGVQDSALRTDYWSGDKNIDSSHIFYHDYTDPHGAYNGAKGFAVSYKWVPFRNSVILLRWMSFKPIHYSKGDNRADKNDYGMKFRNNFRFEWDTYF